MEVAVLYPKNEQISSEKPIIFHSMVIKAAEFHLETIATSFERLWKYDLVGVRMLEARSRLPASILRDMIGAARN